MSMTRIASAASAAVLLATVAVSSAYAMPLGGLKPAADAVQAGTENVAWVCGPYRCGWRPGYANWAPRPYWGPRRFYGGFGPRPFRYGFYGPRRYWR